MSSMTSRPLSRPGMSRRDSDASRKSVGEQLNSNMIWNVEHPLYKALTDQFNERMREIVAREGLRKSSTTPVVLTVSLTTTQLSALQGSYTEFTIHQFPMNSPVHSYWAAAIAMGNEFMASTMRRHTDSFIHYGGSPVSHIFAGNHNVHMVMDPADPCQVHDNHSANLDVVRLFASPVTVGKTVGRSLNMDLYKKFRKREALVCCTRGSLCTQVAEGMCIDLTRSAMGPAQVASAMRQSTASVAYAMLPFHPAMLLQDEGVFPNAEVHFKKSNTHVRFSYPYGVSGVTDFPLEAYVPWLTSHVVQVGSSYYQLEIMNLREFLLFVKIVAINTPHPVGHDYYHALDLPEISDQYLVHSWVLKSLTSDYASDKSWESVTYLASRRVVDRVYQHAMTVRPEDFTRYNVRKQLQLANNRVVVQGTSVTVNPALTSQQVDQLTYAVYCRAFVDRYELNTLTGDLMKALKDIARFHEFSVGARMAALMRACGAFVWDWTFGVVDEKVRWFCDKLRVMMGSIPKERAILFDQAPAYVGFKGVVDAWKNRLLRSFELVYADSAYSKFTPVRPSVVGALCARALGVGMQSSESFRFACSQVFSLNVQDLRTDGRLYVDTVESGVVDQPAHHRELVGALSAINEVEHEPVSRHQYEMQLPVLEPSMRELQKPDYDPQPDYIGVFNRAHEEAFPGLGQQELEYDTASISLDSQDRSLAATYLKLPLYFGDVPKPKAYYKSKISALNVPQRQQTVQELLSATAARNLSAPIVSKPQEDVVLFAEIWENFLVMMCTQDAKRKLREYQNDPVSLGADALGAWMSQATPASLSQVKADLEANSRALSEMPVNEYISMLKSDVKPPLSNKPINSRIEPQVIVYHEKPLSALYSSIFRVLVRRFVSLLRPEIMVNLLKDTDGIRAHIQANHIFGETLKYLENDFSKYDKSQGDFAFGLEEYVFKQLGMDEEMLARWVDGHVKCTIRALSLGISLHVLYQRKSGDATTAFGNVILNVLSVAYAYKGTVIVWAVFMGDDSLVCARRVASEDTAVQVMAEVFNLQAKYYVTDAPYFASNFILIDQSTYTVSLLADPLKRIQRWSMHVSADDPQWQERWISAADVLRDYRFKTNSVSLATSVVQRYSLSYETAAQLCDAIATAVATPHSFRAMWCEQSEVSIY